MARSASIGTTGTTGSRRTFRLTEDWKTANAILDSGHPRILLVGPPGTGKTYAARKRGLDGRHLYTVGCGEENPNAIDLLGSDVVVDGNMVWRDGTAVRALRGPNRLVIDELDKANGDVYDALLKICDEPGSQGFNLPTGEHVEFHPDFQVVATMNGDPEDLSDALRTRFQVTVWIENPHPESIAALPDDLQELAHEMTGTKLDAGRRINIRAFRAYAELRERGVAEQIAAKAAFHHRASDILTALSAAELSGSLQYRTFIYCEHCDYQLGWKEENEEYEAAVFMDGATRVEIRKDMDGDYMCRSCRNYTKGEEREEVA